MYIRKISISQHFIAERVQENNSSYQYNTDANCRRYKVYKFQDILWSEDCEFRSTPVALTALIYIDMNSEMPLLREPFSMLTHWLKHHKFIPFVAQQRQKISIN